MNFGKNDMLILVGSFMVILFMTLVFPSLGLTTDGAEESNIPELDISESTVDLVGERPEWPRTPTSGELRYMVDGTSTERQDVLHRDDDDPNYAVFVETFCWEQDPVNEDCQVQISVFDSDGTEDNYNEITEYVIEESDFEDRGTVELSAENADGEDWEIEVTFVHVENWGSEDIDYRIQWELVDSPEGGDWLSGVPILGGIFSTANEIASVVAWGITIFFWVSAWFVELVINAIGLLINLFLFGIDIVTFMVTNYNGMISETSGFASFILIVPAMLLSVELLKLGFIFISILPTT